MLYKKSPSQSIFWKWWWEIWGITVLLGWRVNWKQTQEWFEWISLVSNFRFYKMIVSKRSLGEPSKKQPRQLDNLDS